MRTVARGLAWEKGGTWRLSLFSAVGDPRGMTPSADVGESEVGVRAVSVLMLGMMPLRGTVVTMIYVCVSIRLLVVPRICIIGIDVLVNSSVTVPGCRSLMVIVAGPGCSPPRGSMPVPTVSASVESSDLDDRS